MTSPPIRRILVATDFSECAGRALEYAAILAGAYSAPVELLHVVEALSDMDHDSVASSHYFELCRKQAERPLDELATHLAEGGLAAKWRLHLGIPSQQINAVATDCGADLVVLGTHGRTGLADVALGSTAERVVRGAPCPVLTVRSVQGQHRLVGNHVAGAAPVIGRILTPVDFSPCSLEALDYAADIAHVFCAAVTILHVIEPIFYDLDVALGHIVQEREKREEAESQLSELVDRLKRRGLSVQTAVRGGITGDSILAGAQGQGCNLIVMGTHGRRGLSQLRTGSIAEAVLRQAQCPVLTVKSRKGPHPGP